MPKRPKIRLADGLKAVGGLVVVLMWSFFSGDANESGELAKRLRSLSFPDIPPERVLPAEWLAIEGSLVGPLAGGSPNSCNRGDADCVPAVVDEMARRLRPLVSSCSHHAPFLLMYMRVTERVANASDVAWEDRAFLNHLDAIFARLYFEARDAWDTGHASEVPEAWRIAFDAADQRAISGIGDLLLGMNAHISRDLPFALAEIGLANGYGISAERDFTQVDKVLAGVQRAVVEEVAARFDAEVAATALPSIGMANLLTSEVITEWRQRAWDDAAELAAADGADRMRVAAEVERTATSRARTFRLLTSYLPGSDHASVRRRHCESFPGWNRASAQDH